MIRAILIVLGLLVGGAMLAGREPTPKTSFPVTATKPATPARTPEQLAEDLTRADRLQAHWTEFKAGKRKDAVNHQTLLTVISDLRKAAPEQARHAEALVAIERLEVINEAVGKAWAPEAARLAKARDQQLAAARVADRRAYPALLERNFLKQGMDVYVTVEGQEATTLRVKYVLMSRPMVYKIQTETDFVQNCRAMGFKKVIMDDGFRSTWVFDL